MAELDEESNKDALAQRAISIIDDGALALLMLVGRRAGLFDVMAGRPPATSTEIAEVAGLNETCVREWLDAMATSGIILHRPAATYELPSAHAASLSRVAVLRKLATLAQCIPLLGTLEDRIVARFKEGGPGFSPASPCFRHVIETGSNQEVVAALVDSILPLVPGLRDVLHSGINVLDIGCGDGRAVNVMAGAFPESRFRGYDPDQTHIDHASWGAFQLGLTNVRFLVRDVATLDEPDRYDLILDFDAIHDRRQPWQAVEKIAEALRPEGTFIMEEIAGKEQVAENLDHPLGLMLYTMSRLHRTTVSRVEETEEPDPDIVWDEERARRVLQEAGFQGVTVHRLPQYFLDTYFVATKKAPVEEAVG
jgi:SAM-dependent methyltransferase